MEHIPEHSSGYVLIPLAHHVLMEHISSTCSLAQQQLLLKTATQHYNLAHYKRSTE